jgi:hypothetical protein
MTKQKASMNTMQEIMSRFSRQTGLDPPAKAPVRYLWTDAFAVCNFLELFHRTRDDTFARLARELVDQVHNILGRHREDDARKGWISGLEEQEGRNHPTVGGLRIGKEMSERKAGEPFDERLEWERDGQYYHYLTKWMHALHRMSRVLEESVFHRWAVELAKTAHARFTYVPPSGGQKRIFWKMSIDLSRPLLPSMGQHDPLDGFITYNQLQCAALENSEASTSADLRGEISDLAVICEGRPWVTDDPLGLGGLLTDAFKLAQLTASFRFDGAALLRVILEDALLGLKSYVTNNTLNFSADHRLAFRELGLSVGLHAVDRLWEFIGASGDVFGVPILRPIEALRDFGPLAKSVETFWLEPENQETHTWEAHAHINMIMLATSLGPDGYLRI